MPTDGRDIWQSYAKGVKPVSKRSNKSRDTDKILGENKHRNRIVPLAAKPLLSTNGDSAGIAQRKALPEVQFTKKAERALREGTISIDAKLDLHGMRQTQAYAALEKFMAAQIKRGHRNLLIITGKGSTGQSVLRANLPAWLENLGAPLLRLAPAALRHGGGGAFYVILKRRRD